MRDAWKKHAAITLRGGEAMELADTLAQWRDVLPGAPAGDDDE